MDDLGTALVVEDDDDVRQLLRDVLEQAGFSVQTASSGRQGVDLAREHSPVVVTLDIGLPDIDGLEVLRRIRQMTDAYIVMLTGRDDETDTLLALQAGADDYMTKPFRPRELRARLAAMLRRPRASVALAMTGSPAAAPPEAAGQREAAPAVVQRPAQPSHVIQHNGLTVDTATRTAALDGETLDLTRSEFDLLRALLTGGGRVLTRSELVRVARGDRFRVDAYISEADERAV